MSKNEFRVRALRVPLTNFLFKFSLKILTGPLDNTVSKFHVLIVNFGWGKRSREHMDRLETGDVALKNALNFSL